jgi:hypothetical protein
MTSLASAILGGILGWLIWRLAPRQLHGSTTNLPVSDSRPRENTGPNP